MEIRQIEHNTHDYRQALELRNNVLRKPLGMSLYDEHLEKENLDIHIGAFEKDTIIGVLILTFLDKHIYKMRQVAVSESYRSKKVGTQVVYYSEELLIQLGAKKIVLNAREEAVEFYKKLGYTIISPLFYEIGISHYKMQKSL